MASNLVEIIFKAIDAGATSTTRQVGDAFKKEMQGIQTGTNQLGQSGVILDKHGNKLVDVSEKTSKTAQSQWELGKKAEESSGKVGQSGDVAVDTAGKTEKLGQKNKDTEESYIALAAAAGIAFWGITRVMGNAIDASNQYRNAMLGLESIATSMGHDFDKVQSAAESLAKDGLMTVSSAATSLKNLLTRGFSLDEAVTMMNRFKDSAAFGRQASLGFGQAIEGATEGIRNENSVLVDNAGVTKNVSKMWADYAKELGKGGKSVV